MELQVHCLDQKLLGLLLLLLLHNFWSMQFSDKFSSIDSSPSLTTYS